MSCENLQVPAPLTTQCPTLVYGIPWGSAGRVVANTAYEPAGIVLHCYSGTVNQLCNELKCATKNSIVSGSAENSYHYGVGISGHAHQFVHPDDISWSFGAYKNNSYATVPNTNTPINWPTLQSLYGINTTPDVYTINIALALGVQIDATGCYECPTSSGLPQNQHDELVHLLAYLVQEYGIIIDTEHIQFHDNIRCDDTQECPCLDIESLLSEVAAYCPPCEGDEAPLAPEAQPTDTIDYLMGITEACCPDSPGCYVKIPWDGCFLGNLAVDGDLSTYILGLTQDPVTEQWCLTRGCLATTSPLIGCGTVDDPLRMDLCAWGSYIPDQAADTVVNLVGLDDAGCMIEAPAADIVALYETPITPVDTATVDLTVSGTSDHTLQADVNISAEANNQVEVRPDGLFVDFTCIDFVDAYPEDDIAVFIGQNAAGDCVHQDAADVVTNEICAIVEDMDADPEWLLGKTDELCPVFVTPASIIEAGLVVNDTSTVNLTLVGDTLTADILIDPAVDNILEVTVNGLYVPDLTVIDTNCIDITYVGRQLTVDVIIDPAVDNVLECRANGLYSPLGGGITVSDTDCLDLTLVGGVLSGIITLAPTQGLVPNIAQCIPGQGFYVPQGGGLNVTDTNCIDLTISNGNLTADLLINPSGDNQAQCGPGGLFVPIGAGLIANDTDCVNHSLVGGVLSTTLNFAPPQGGIPNILNCIPGQGLYVPESHIGVIDTTCIDLTFAGGILSAAIILDPTGDNQVQCLPAGLYVPPTAGLIVDDTDCISLNLAGDTLTSSPILAPAQAGNANALQCIPGEGLYVPTTGSTNLVVNDTSCIDLTLAGNVLTADPIISPDDCNGLECRGNGLWLNNDIQSVGVNSQLPQQVLGTAFTITGTPWVEVGNDITVQITNPSTCNSMRVTISVNGVGFGMVNDSGTADAVIAAGYGWSIDGAPLFISTNYTGSKSMPLGSVEHFASQGLNNSNVVIAPGAVMTFRVQPIVSSVNGTLTGNVTIDSYSVVLTGINFI